MTDPAKALLWPGQCLLPKASFMPLLAWPRHSLLQFGAVRAQGRAGQKLLTLVLVAVTAMQASEWQLWLLCCSGPCDPQDTPTQHATGAEYTGEFDKATLSFLSSSTTLYHTLQLESWEKHFPSFLDEQFVIQKWSPNTLGMKNVVFLLPGATIQYSVNNCNSCSD